MRLQLAVLLFCSLIIFVSCSSRQRVTDPDMQGSQAAELTVQQASDLSALLPALSELPAVERGFSAIPEDYIRKGSELAGPLTKDNAIIFGDSLLLGPNWDPLALPPKRDFAWGIYSFHLPGFDRKAELDLFWAEAPPAADCYVAVTDYGHDRWRWFKSDGDDHFELGTLAGHFSNFDTLQVCVLLTGTDSFELQRLRLGGNFAPTASFTVSKDNGQYNFTSGFNATASSDVDGSIAEYHWSFEDPVFFYPGDIGPTPNWTYDHVGTFTCTLRVIDNEGGTGEATATINVSGEPGNMLPMAMITPSKTGGPLPPGIVFDAIGSTDPDQGILYYRWDLDDDGYYEVQTSELFAYREFTSAGTFTVGVMVVDFLGAWATATTEITITPISGENPPSAAIGVDYYCRQSGSGPHIFDTSGCSDPDNDIIKYEWDFEGDGSFDYDFGLLPFANVTYTIPGEYTPTVRITDSGGRQATASLGLISSSGVDPQETEPNNSVAEAESLGGFLNYAKYISGWTGELGGADTADWYLIDSARDAETSFWVDFNSTVVDLGIALYSADDLLAPLIDADLGGDREYFHFYIPAAGQYLLKVFVPEGAVETGPGKYSLTCLENKQPFASLSANPDFGDVPFQVTLDASLSTDLDGFLESYDYDLDDDGVFEVLFEGSTYMVDITLTGSHTFAVRVTDNLGEQAIAKTTVAGF